MTKKAGKRLLMLMLVMTMVMAALLFSAVAATPVAPTGSFSYSSYLDVSASNSNSADTGSVTMSGTTITATAKGYAGSGCNATDEASNTTVTLTAKTDIESIGYTTSDSLTYVSGPQSGESMVAGASLVFIVNSEAGASSTVYGSVTITEVKIPIATYTTTFGTAQYGTYSVTYNGASVSVPGSDQAANDKPYVLTAVPSAGYKLKGWSDGTSILSSSNPYSYTAASNATIVPVFVPSDCAMYKVGSAYYDYLDQAISAAGTNGTIIVYESGAVYGSAGQTSFTIAKNVKLLVPKSAGDTGTFESTAEQVTGNNVLYRYLTLHSSTTIECNGSIGVSGGQNVANGGSPSGIAKGPYGQIRLDSGAVLNMNSGSNMYCYGFVIGDGTVNLQSGANLYELMQVMDWRGGSCSSGAMNYNSLFAMNQYYIQNVESNLNMYSGANGWVSATVTVSSLSPSLPVKYFGSDGLFRLNGGSLSRKLEGSRMVYALNDGELSIDSISLTVDLIVKKIELSSKSGILGVPSNMTIIAKNGTMNITNAIALLPSAEVVIAKDATANISGDVYLIDYAVWKGHNYATHDVDYYPLPYTCANGTNGTKLGTLGSSKLQVDGTLNVQSGGGIYTTTGKNSTDVGITGTGVFNIASSDEAPGYALRIPVGVTDYTKEENVPPEAPTATALMTQAGKSASTTDLVSYQTGNHAYYGTSDSHTAANWYEYLVTVKDGTAGVVPGAAPTAGADYATVTRGGQTFQNVVGYAVSGGTFSFTVSGTGVSAVKANGTALTPDENGVYTLTVTGDTELEIERAATYTVTWKNADGTVLATDENVAEGTMPEYNGEIPTKAEDANNYYVFSGWDEALEPVTEDVTYTAVYAEKAQNYSIEVYYNVNGVRGEEAVLSRTYSHTQSVRLGAEPEYTDGDKVYSFSHWDVDGVKYPALKITARPESVDHTVIAQAVYVENADDAMYKGDALIQIIRAERETVGPDTAKMEHKWVFTLTQSVPTDKAEEVGFVVSQTVPNPRVDTEGVYKAVSNLKTATSTFTTRVNVTGQESLTLYVRAYVKHNGLFIYSDEQARDYTFSAN